MALAIDDIAYNNTGTTIIIGRLRTNRAEVKDGEMAPKVAKAVVVMDAKNSPTKNNMTL